jgi:hypothetical protein
MTTNDDNFLRFFCIYKVSHCLGRVNRHPLFLHRSRSSSTNGFTSTSTSRNYLSSRPTPVLARCTKYCACHAYEKTSKILHLPQKKDLPDPPNTSGTSRLPGKTHSSKKGTQIAGKSKFSEESKAYYTHLARQPRQTKWGPTTGTLNEPVFIVTASYCILLQEPLSVDTLFGEERQLPQKTSSSACGALGSWASNVSAVAPWTVHRRVQGSFAHDIKKGKSGCPSWKEVQHA